MFHLQSTQLNLALLTGKPHLLSGCVDTHHQNENLGVAASQTHFGALVSVLHERKESLIVSAMYEFEQSMTSLLPVHYILLPSMCQATSSMLMFRYVNQPWSDMGIQIISTS